MLASTKKRQRIYVDYLVGVLGCQWQLDVWCLSGKLAWGGPVSAFAQSLAKEFKNICAFVQLCMHLGTSQDYDFATCKYISRACRDNIKGCPHVWVHHSMPCPTHALKVPKSQLVVNIKKREPPRGLSRDWIPSYGQLSFKLGVVLP